jgi:hypothetical protein
MKMLLCALLLSYQQPLSPTQPTVLLQNFLLDVAGQQLNETELIEKYLCASFANRRGQDGDMIRYVFHTSVEYYREEFKKRDINPKDITITPFDQLTIKPAKIAGDTKGVYEGQYKGEHFCYFLIENNKIASLNLIHKDAKSNFFLSYCE